MFLRKGTTKKLRTSRYKNLGPSYYALLSSHFTSRSKVPSIDFLLSSIINTNPINLLEQAAADKVEKGAFILSHRNHRGNPWNHLNYNSILQFTLFNPLITQYYHRYDHVNIPLFHCQGFEWLWKARLARRNISRTTQDEFVICHNPNNIFSVRETTTQPTLPPS